MKKKWVHVQLADGTYGVRTSVNRDYKYAIVREGFTVEEALDRFTYEIQSSVRVAADIKDDLADPDHDAVEVMKLRKAHEFWLNRRDLLEKYRMQLDDALDKGTATLTDPAWEVLVDEPRGAFYLTPVRPEVIGWSQTERNAYKRQVTEANRNIDRVSVLPAIPGRPASHPRRGRAVKAT